MEHDQKRFTTDTNKEDNHYRENVRPNKCVLRRDRNWEGEEDDFREGGMDVQRREAYT